MAEQLSTPTGAAPAQPAPAQPTAAAASLPAVPATWPGAFGVYKYSKQAVKVNLGTLIIIWLLDFVVSGIFEAVLKSAGGIVSLLLSSLLVAAFALTYLAGIRGQRLSVGEALGQALPLWLKMIGLLILVYISMVISLLLFVIPFFFVMPRLVLAIYYLVDKKMGIVEAYQASWNATKGNAGKVWGIIGASLAMVLLMITIIGIPFSIYFLIMYSAAIVVLYEYLGKSKPAAAPVASSPAPATPAASTSPAPTPPAQASS